MRDVALNHQLRCLPTTLKSPDCLSSSAQHTPAAERISPPPTSVGEATSFPVNMYHLLGDDSGSEAHHQKDLGSWPWQSLHFSQSVYSPIQWG